MTRALATLTAGVLLAALAGCGGSDRPEPNDTDEERIEAVAVAFYHETKYGDPYKAYALIDSDSKKDCPEAAFRLGAAVIRGLAGEDSGPETITSIRADRTSATAEAAAEGGASSLHLRLVKRGETWKIRLQNGCDADYP